MPKATKQRTTFVLSVDLPSGVSPARFQAWVKTDIASNIGYLPPSDPLFNMDPDTLSIAYAGSELV
jgi:hypothetical protein